MWSKHTDQIRNSFQWVCSLLYCAFCKRHIMAGRSPQEGATFRFDRVEIIQDDEHTLGIGSYGAVYKAKCDQLDCAAKILHPILFQTFDPASSIILERFRQECDFMSAIRHPNIVQYLGGTLHPESRRPVLLMELLDESLTKLLERSFHVIPFHIQVTLAHGIILALAYLHSNQIIHRDMSSNNVLVLAGRKAKVTDFGMSRILGDTRNQTTLPGTEVYMPPECFVDEPNYDEKMDIFSFGVLMIQIITRQFPNPTTRIVSCPTDQTSARIIPERERRRSHIEEIPSTHPFVAPALQCLEVAPSRPSAQDLCRHFDRFQTQDQYIQSKEAEMSNGSIPQMAAIQSELARRENEIRVKDQQLAEANDSLRAREAEIARLRGELSALERTVSEKDSQIEQLQATRTSHEDTQLTLHWESQGRAPCVMACGSCIIEGDIAYIRPAGKTQIYTLYRSTREWSELVKSRYQDSSLAFVGGNLVAVGGREGYKDTGVLLTYTKRKSCEWEEHLPQMQQPRSSVCIVRDKSTLITAGGMVGHNPVPTVEVLNIDSHHWHQCTDLPTPVFLASGCVVNNRVYLVGGWKRQGEESNLVVSASLSDYRRLRWDTLPTLPYANATCTAVNGVLISIGGRGLGLGATSTTNVYKYSEDRWEKIEPLGTARSSGFVLNFGEELYVVGGYVGRRNISDDIEVAVVQV